jgi:LacI family transcriptional regulator
VAGVTLDDVAALAGVSQPTASRVLNGSARTPSPAVVEAVRRAADELGYVSNAQAQALARSHSGLIGLVVHDLADPYFSTIAAGAQREAAQRGRQMLVATTLRSPAQELSAVMAFIGYRTDAIVLAGSRSRCSQRTKDHTHLKQSLTRYVGNGGRLAVIGQRFAGAHSVEPENLRGAAALAAALVDQGRREFVVLAGPRDLITAADRCAGFVAELKRRDVVPRAVVHGEFTRDGGYAAARMMVEQLGLTSHWGGCVFAVNDVMALGAAAALRDAGLRIPADVGVAGFDDIPTLRDHAPALTTVGLPLADLGASAVALALSGDHGDPPTRRRVTGQVLLRASTRLPARSAVGVGR